MFLPNAEKYEGIVVLNDDTVTNAILKQMVDAPQSELSDFYAQDARTGQFYLVRDSDYPGKVLEYVPDAKRDTSVTTLYVEHPFFATRQALLNARKDLIESIERRALAMPGTMTILDEGRQKHCHLFELGTAQLFDIYKQLS